jgi:hypothetical protein
MRRLLVFFFIVVGASCIDPYIPNLKQSKPLLVVEGLITNDKSSYKIKLSRTTQKRDSNPEMVTDANVNVIDEAGIKTNLQNCGDGYYKTDSILFIGVIGKKYTLQIFTADNKEYKSKECTMYPVAKIDTLYYEKVEESSGTLNVLYTGIKILLNSSDSNGTNNYFRWTFDESWKTILPGAEKYKYYRINDTTFTFRGVPPGNEICWKESISTSILVNSILSSGRKNIDKQEIQFIAPDISDKLTQQYSILVKQYSISQKEYNFWNNLKKVGETNGDIFGLQPFPVTSNIFNVNDRSEMVFGYFEVSAVNQRRLNISADELNPLFLPHYVSNCVNVVISPSDYPKPFLPTWDELYWMWMDTRLYTFVGPIVNQGVILEGSVYQHDLKKFVFSRNACAFCKYPGSITKKNNEI